MHDLEYGTRRELNNTQAHFVDETTLKPSSRHPRLYVHEKHRGHRSCQKCLDVGEAKRAVARAILVPAFVNHPAGRRNERHPPVLTQHQRPQHKHGNEKIVRDLHGRVQKTK